MYKITLVLAFFTSESHNLNTQMYPFDLENCLMDSAAFLETVALNQHQEEEPNSDQ